MDEFDMERLKGSRELSYSQLATGWLLAVGLLVYFLR
jgi:hypothetical protein